MSSKCLAQSIRFLQIKRTGLWHNFHIIELSTKRSLNPITYINMNFSTLSVIRSGKASPWIPLIVGNSLPYKAARFVFGKPNSLLSSCPPSWNFHPLILVLPSRITQRKSSSLSTGQIFKYLKAGVMFPTLRALVLSALPRVTVLEVTDLGLNSEPFPY